MSSLLFFVAIGRGNTWDLWNEANNLYWGTVYGTTPATPLAGVAEPRGIRDLVDGQLDPAVRHHRLACPPGCWAGWRRCSCRATRVLLAAASDGVLPPSVSRTTGDSVPLGALSLLVVPACALAALDAYWGAFAEWTSVAVVALALTTAGSGVAAVIAFRRENRLLAGVSMLFVLAVAIVVAVWVLDPVYGMRTLGSLVFLAFLYAIASGVFVLSRHQRELSKQEPELGQKTGVSRHTPHTSRSASHISPSVT